MSLCLLFVLVMSMDKLPCLLGWYCINICGLCQRDYVIVAVKKSRGACFIITIAAGIVSYSASLHTANKTGMVAHAQRTILGMLCLCECLEQRITFLQIFWQAMRLM